jgi:predicted acylesterase/phospholipase RssA
VTNTANIARPYALVMKGGGMKGLAYIGTLRELQQRFPFDWYVGTSAGAVTAVLLAAGHSVDEMDTLLRKTDFEAFLDANPLQAVLNLLFFQGIYRARTFTAWLDRLLAEKLGSFDRVLLEHLPTHVTVYACKRDYGPIRFDSWDPERKSTPAAHAVRCSMSIPLFFTPEKEFGMNMFDGGMRYNYPVPPTVNGEPVPFIGLYLGPRIYEPHIKTSLVQDLLNIWTEAPDRERLRACREETIIIDTSPISTLDFFAL